MTFFITKQRFEEMQKQSSLPTCPGAIHNFVIATASSKLSPEIMAKIASNFSKTKDRL